jgi:hypothetical protein
MTARGKRTFWITANPTALHQERVALLNKNGFDALLMPGMKELLQQNASQRASCIFIDTPEPSNSERIQMINQLAMMPEMNGVRFILIATQHTPDAYRVAVAENFRDIIPLKLDSEVWLHRVQFATGAKPSEFSAPLCEISMNQVAIAMAPARIIWINETHIRIECRGNQRIGSALQISGQIAASFGVPHLSLTVESIHKDQLQFRFSQALICRWRIAAAQSELASSLIRRLPSSGQGTRFRAFVAVSKSDLRKNVITRLGSARFDIKVGLQRANLAKELRYFSPDVVFMDDHLLKTLTVAELRDIFGDMPAHVPAVILGSEQDRRDFAERLGQRRLYIESENQPDFALNAGSRFRLTANLTTTKTGEPTRPIEADHPWSKIDVLVPTRLTSLNPSVGEISLPYSMGSFSLVKLEAPILRRSLGRDPYIKITNTTEVTSTLHATQFNHHAHFYLADVDREEQAKLSNNLMLMVENYYQKEFSTTTPSTITNQQTTTPIAIPTTLPTTTPPSLPSTSANVNSSDQLSTRTSEDLTDPAIDLDDSPKRNWPRTTRKLIQSKSSLDRRFDWPKNIDPTIVKAALVFVIAIGVMMIVLSFAMNVDESFYKDHGRQYSDFFQRMTNPEFRKANPAPGIKRLERDNGPQSESPP